MTSNPFNLLLTTYTETLTALEQEGDKLPPEKILAALLARDQIQKALHNSEPPASQLFLELHQADERLKKLATAIQRNGKLEAWRTTQHAPTEAWWWYLQSPSTALERYDWLWDALALLCLTVTLALLVNIVPRFIDGGPDALGTFAVVLQSALAMLAAGGALTRFGREALEKVWRGLGIPQKLWQVLKFGLAGLVLFIIFVFHRSLPQIAVSYNASGVAHYQAGRLASAQFDFVRALKLDPDNPQTHYNLGSVYEDLGEMEKARAEYRVAMAAGSVAAHNNLGRLLIFGDKPNDAIPILLRGWQNATDPEVKYDLKKNIGWARVKQKAYDEALIVLQEAVSLAPNRAPAHCLLAQTLDGQNKNTEAFAEWEKCNALADPTRPDEDAWLLLARQRLAKGKP